jgi:hypothetical protein
MYIINPFLVRPVQLALLSITFYFMMACSSDAYNVDVALNCKHIQSGAIELIIHNEQNIQLLRRRFAIPSECSEKTEVYSGVIKEQPFNSLIVQAKLYKDKETSASFYSEAKWPGKAGLSDGKGNTILLELQVDGERKDRMIAFEGLI